MLVAKFHIFMQQILNFDGFTFPHSQWVRTDLRAFLTDALQDGRVSVNSSAMAAIIIFPIKWPFGRYTADNILKDTPLKSNLETLEVTNLGRFFCGYLVVNFMSIHMGLSENRVYSQL
jgi:hypothetical protein